jgi:hypothetical protein
MRGQQTSRWRELALLAGGAAVVVLLSSLPVVGPWVKFVVILLGLGAVFLWLRDWRRGATAAPGDRVQPSEPSQAPQAPVTPAT